ncbi:MAG: undecaprenyl/decaprenyl-phosphate alpha-N-acetylglucosaminyl 1-phosphate transferase [Syntrophomonadaceae bacterium]|nr:undecaprenyl/decaprenyl-phosphate alpha-N-acetylglucosaminyl 1-phosphate transferase [Syntrophomonadaceae bacterium]
MVIWYIIALVSAFVISFVGVPLTAKMAFKIGAVDKPSARKVHKAKMPRLGGLGIFIAFTVTALIFLNLSAPVVGVLVGACVITVVGVLDDIYQLSPVVKLLGQSIAAVVAMSFGVMVHFLTNPFDGLLWLGYLSIPITFLWIVGVTNAINLIDGLDGLAAGVSAIAAATMGVVALLNGGYETAFMAFILVAALSGFIPYNFFPARTFMGDGGSNLLGFLLSCIAVLGAVKSAAIFSLFIPIVILGIPILDTFFAIIRRINRKAPIFKPDKGHLHHQLLAMGLSHRNSVLVIYSISGLLGVIACICNFLSGPKATLLGALLLLIIVWGADKLGLFSATGEHKAKTMSLKESASDNKLTRS